MVQAAWVLGAGVARVALGAGVAQVALGAVLVALVQGCGVEQLGQVRDDAVLVWGHGAVRQGLDGAALGDGHLV